MTGVNAAMDGLDDKLLHIEQCKDAIAQKAAGAEK